MMKGALIAGLLGALLGCSPPAPREINRFQAPPPEGSALAAQLEAIPGLRRKPSGHYAGLEEIVARHFPVGSREEVLLAFLNREGFGRPLVPEPGAEGASERVSYTGAEIRGRFENLKRRQQNGTSLTGSFLYTECGRFLSGASNH
ncbi:MAG: hypothetical protein AAGE76_14490, partial [Pseudomonadota bacterium]